MATVKILYDDDATKLENYLKQKEGREAPTTERSCLLDGMAKEFPAVQNDYGSKGNNSIHLIQSWSPKESKRLTPEQVHGIGVELAERFAPGHQFVVQTHGDQAHLHNHIVINPVSMETGKRIQNKLENIRTVRGFNDEICQEHGLEVLPPQEKLTRPGPSERAKRIDTYRGRSYIVDLANKTDFAGRHATNYDEYVSILNAFDIQVRIEPKNITYFYPGRNHGKRGRNLGPALDKPGLEARFQRNWESFQKSPDLKKNLSELVQAHRPAPTTIRGQVQVGNPGCDLVSKRAEEWTKPRTEELAKSIIPLEELQKAKTYSILKYCEKQKIGVVQGENGTHLLKGRESVVLSDYTWVNQRNKTQGNVIDFVANHRQVDFLEAVSIINDNPRLMLLKSHMGERKKHHQSFYIPKDDPAPRNSAINTLAHFLGHPSSHPVHEELFKRQMVHVNSRGTILFSTEKSSAGYVQFVPEPQGSYRTDRQGVFLKPFLHRTGKAAELTAYSDVRTFLRKEPEAFSKKSNSKHSVLVLFEPDLQSVHNAVASERAIKHVTLIQSKANSLSEFHQELKKSLDPFSIDTTLAWEPSCGLNCERAREPDHSQPFQGR